jgi:Flp pilus assembly protein TadD
MIRPSVRSAGLAVLLSMNGCGHLLSSSGTGAGTPGLNVAEAALQSGAGQIALAVSEGVLSRSPNDVHAQEIKGDALALMGDNENATAIFQALLARDPGSIRANTGLGRVTLAKDPAAAEALFLKVLRRDPKDLTALNNLGIARDLRGHHAEAQVAYRDALVVSPDLESAQINLALSLAMSGHAAEAVRMLHTKASQPDASLRVRHDYAVALALSGNRPEAERVLSENLSPEDVRQVLDSATGTHTKLARDAGQPGLGRGYNDNDGIPPDVVQVPEVAATKVTQAPGLPVSGLPVSGLPVSGSVAASPLQATSTMASVPMVVRPHPADADSDAPLTQPVDPVAAAATNLRPLSLRVRARDGATPVSAPVSATVSTDDESMVAMPRTRAVSASAELAAGGVMPPAAPAQTLSEPAASSAPVPPDLPALSPVAPGYSPAVRSGYSSTVSTGYRTATGSVAPSGAGQKWTSPEAGVPATPSTTLVEQSRPASVDTAMAFAAPPEATRQRAEPASQMAAISPRSIPSERSRAAIQFIAAPSEEAAYAFWNDLLHRYPEMLAQRQPVVIRLELGGKVLWRVRAEGFDSNSDAQALCARMRAGGQDCFVPRS